MSPPPSPAPPVVAAPRPSSLADVEAALAPPLAALLAEARAAEQLGQRGAARDRYEALLRALSSADQAPLASALLRWIGRLHDADADAGAAIDCLTAALAVAEATGDAAGAAHAHNVLASIHLHRGELDEAAPLYERAFAGAAAAGESRLVALVRQNLGVVAMIRGDAAEGERHFRESLAGFRALGLHLYAAHALNNLGLASVERRAWDEAERAYAEACEACEGAGGDAGTRVMIEVNRAAFWIARRDFHRAAVSCDAASVLAELARDDRALAETNKHRGVIAREQREFRRAAQCFALARAVADGRRDLLLEAEIAREQAELAWVQRRSTETLNHLNRAHRLFGQIRAQRLAADVDRRLGTLEESFIAIVRGWSASIESADRYTRGHCDRVADYACALAAESGLDAQTLFWFRMGALLHDVGKIVVPGEILNKAGPLTPEERIVMQSHPGAGVEILTDIDFPWDIRPMVRHHHEQWNGGGYPDGLAGEAIPLPARILCVADVYDALTSERPYRAAYSHARALEVMRSMEGSFDPVLFARFVRVAERHPHWPLVAPAPVASAPAAPPPAATQPGAPRRGQVPLAPPPFARSA